MYNNILDVKGLKVGQAQNEDALTGCTVVICEKGATFNPFTSSILLYISLYSSY